jgi:hypothetical protein
MWVYGRKAPIEGYGINFNAANKGTPEGGPFSISVK